ncbi:serine hydrolase domain-containing protein [Actinomadura terrae]|uniref:serine hydrolase domain-containing protein n=1 Tax=Actinomadura terrae TaxID=604353 RepID=UPI001FA752BD|nr:serine hydrolase domain-containing protein [Actinomadura terrae]
MTVMRAMALAVVMVAAVPATAVAQTPPANDALTKVVTEAKAPSVIARWGVDGRSYEFRYGARRAGEHAPAVQGVFRIGSVTKTFTATVVLQLVGEGRLSLADDVERLLPGAVPDGASGITVRHLLRHTSGLPEYPDESAFEDSGALKDPFRTWTPRALLSAIKGRPREPLGTFHYAQTNYVLLGMIIEKVTGMRYATAVEQRVLRPLNLTHTYVPGTETVLRGRHNRGYVLDGGRYVDVTALNPSIMDAAGRIVSDTRDLAAFQRGLPRILAPAQINEMRTPTPGGSYGAGVENIPLKCGTFYGHAGGVPGYFTLTAASKDGRRWFAASATLNGPQAIQGLVSTMGTALNAALCP